MDIKSLLALRLDKNCEVKGDCEYNIIGASGGERPRDRVRSIQ